MSSCALPANVEPGPLLNGLVAVGRAGGTGLRPLLLALDGGGVELVSLPAAIAADLAADLRRARGDGPRTDGDAARAAAWRAASEDLAPYADEVDEAAAEGSRVVEACVSRGEAGRVRLRLRKAHGPQVVLTLDDVALAKVGAALG